jgi:hypothetical protein
MSNESYSLYKITTVIAPTVYVMSNSTETTGINKHLTMAIIQSGFPLYFNEKEVKCCSEML